MTAGRKTVTNKKDWCTPEKYVLAVKKVFGGKIRLDPCSNKHSIINAEVELYQHDNGLKHEWKHDTIYVNPPYGIDKIGGTKISDWLCKCAESYEKYGSEILALVPVATNTNHWKKYVFGVADAVCFLFDTRLKFLLNGKCENKGAPMACAMIYYGNNYDVFYSVFKKYGAVINTQNLKIEQV